MNKKKKVKDEEFVCIVRIKQFIQFGYDPVVFWCHVKYLK